jgi:hypothetical protein
MNINDSLLGSTLSNYKQSEIESLKQYLLQLNCKEISPELLLYNFTRFVRTQEITKFLVFENIYRKILEIHGDVVEFGVHNGNTLFAFAHLSEIFEHRNYTRHIYGVDPFDSYELPGGKILSHDLKSLRYSIDLFNKTRVQSQFNKIRLLEKTFDSGCDQLTKSDNFICALLVMHIGLYESEKYVLQNIWATMPKGAVILFGSLGSEDTPQCTKALKDSIGIENFEIKRFPFATKYCYIVK